MDMLADDSYTYNPRRLFFTLWFEA